MKQSFSKWSWTFYTNKNKIWYNLCCFYFRYVFRPWAAHLWHWVRYHSNVFFQFRMELNEWKITYKQIKSNTIRLFSLFYFRRFVFTLVGYTWKDDIWYPVTVNIGLSLNIAQYDSIKLFVACIMLQDCIHLFLNYIQLKLATKHTNYILSETYFSPENQWPQASSNLYETSAFPSSILVHCLFNITITSSSFNSIRPQSMSLRTI